MSKTQLVQNTGTLGDIVKAEARIAMPDVIDVFISKYETELFERKAFLQGEISGLKKDGEMHTAQVKKAGRGKFDSYIGVKIAKLGVISFTNNEVSVDWEDGTFHLGIGLRNIKDDGTEDLNRNQGTGFNKSYTAKMTALQVAEHRSFADKIQKSTEELASICGLISDMSRKERQVKARISELRLKEQGLEGFLADPEMQKLIAI